MTTTRKHPQFFTGEIYHIYNRGVDKRDVVMDDDDRLRFVHCLFNMNDRNAVAPRRPSRSDRPALPTEIGSLSSGHLPGRPKGPFAKAPPQPRDCLVNILCWCLMPNHLHLMVRQCADGGISLFMQKLGIGYTSTFNTKYERSGALFQGKFKAVHVANDAYFLHLPFYIHANPIDLIEYGWKEDGVKDAPGVMRFLESYRWSSYPDYVGERNMPSLLGDKDFVHRERNTEEYREAMRLWISEENFKHLAPVALD